MSDTETTSEPQVGDVIPAHVFIGKSAMELAAEKLAKEFLAIQESFREARP